MHLANSSASSTMFLKNAIEKIFAEKDIRRKENAELRKACESTLGMIITYFVQFLTSNISFLRTVEILDWR